MASQQNPTYITRSDPPKGSPSSSMKPTLLAFHGSGSNATIHTVQLARLMRFIKPHFEIESLEGTYLYQSIPTNMK
jgi:predicted esterase